MTTAPDAPSPTPFGPRAAAEIALLLLAVAAVAWPLISPPKQDDFPLSPYLMFADNKDTTTTVVQAVATLPDGQERILGPRFLGTDEVLQARAILMKAKRDGKRAQMELCWRLAQGVARDASLASAEGVELRTVTYDSLLYFATDAPSPLKKTSHAHCAVKR